MICKLSDAKRRFAQKSVLRLKAKWKLHSQTQENSKMICNSPATARRFAQKKSPLEKKLALQKKMRIFKNILL